MSALGADLMQRYCRGDAAAFRELYAAVAPRVWGYLVKMSRDRALADDLLQQTFLKVHRARGAYIAGADPVPWIFAIAHRTFIDETRRQKRQIARVVDRAGADPRARLSGEPEDAPRPADPGLTSAAFAALAELPPQQREAVVLTKLDGRSIAEAAEIAGTTPGAMKVRAHRGYAALRRALEARHE